MMESQLRTPLQATSNIPSRLPGLRKLPVPVSATKLPTAAAPKTKRSRSNEEPVAAPVKRRKLSDDRPPPTAARKLATRPTTGRGPAARTTGTGKAAAVTRPTATTSARPTAVTTSARPRVGSAPTSGHGNRAANATTAKSTTAGGGAKKAARPGWDLKGRLQDVEEQMRALTDKYRAAKDSNVQGDQQIKVLASEKESILQEHEGCKRQISDLKSSLSERDDKLADVRRTLADCEHDKSQLKRSLTSVEDDFSAAQAHIRGLKASVADMSAAHEQIKAQNDVLKINLETANTTISSKNDIINERTKELESTKDLVAKLEEKIRGFETERRKLHNTIQELKGNIRVFCRVRPLLEQEVTVTDSIEHLDFQEDGKTLEVARLSEVGTNETLSSNRKGSKYEFKYDRVFTPESSQADVFDEISQLVQSALDGYNVCIFAYGQTGSGKTFTMEGAGEQDAALQGMIPRSVNLIFDFISTLLDKGWNYTLEASFLEIYNESIRDLLSDETKDNNVKHDIKMVAAHSNEVYVTNLTTVKVTERHEVHRLLKKAAHARAVAETRCNARSSRSHSVFRLRISGHNQHTDEKCTGLLNLIDLAGSERVKESGSEGARLKEATAINGSLSHLGNVIMALANKESHIPYRNSKLTHLLQNCLGGSSKVLMFVNVSPREDCVSETLNSLRFATKVNNCHIGTAQKKVK